MLGNDSIFKYQQICYKNYLRSIGLPDSYTYPDGNPIRPLPPAQTAAGELIIIGAYPSARFESRPSRLHPTIYRLIPIADNLQPFGYKQYFDGLRVRTLKSADGLQKFLLSKIGRTPQQCWITDIVKVFLYKDSHIESCQDVYPAFQMTTLSSKFKKLAKKSLNWLQDECQICQPKLIVAPGEESAQVISDELTVSADILLERDIIYPSNLKDYPTLFHPHPDASRRFKKWRQKIVERIEIIKSFIDDKNRDEINGENSS